MEEHELQSSARMFAGVSAALISYAAWGTCVIAARGVKNLGTTSDDYGHEWQSGRSLEVEHWLYWTSGGWFLLGCLLLWAGMRGRKVKNAAFAGLLAVFLLVVAAVFVVLAIP
ncbi:hypothetical protein [Segniliparus rugosus]|nr:hypothetical protein [Segniliparus rugosus]